MSCPNLLPGWEAQELWDVDTDGDYGWEWIILFASRTLYRYTATGHVQTNFPRVGDEFLHSNQISKDALSWISWRDAIEDLRSSPRPWYSVRKGFLYDESKAEGWTSMSEGPPGRILDRIVPLEKPWIPYYREHESIGNAHLGLWVDPMNLEPKAVHFNYLAHICMTGSVFFVLFILYDRWISYIISLERFRLRHRAESVEKLSTRSIGELLTLYHPLELPLAIVRNIVAFVISGLIVSVISFPLWLGPSFLVIYSILALWSLLAGVTYIIRRSPSKNPGASVMGFRLDTVVSGQLYGFLAPLPFWCTVFFSRLTTLLQVEPELAGQKYSYFLATIVPGLVLVAWIFCLDIIDQSVWASGQRLRQFLSPMEISSGIGRVRMDWECHCGIRKSDYFFESEPGAVQRLADRMHSDGSIRQSTVTAQPITVFSVLSRNISNLFVSLGLLQRKERGETLPDIEPSDRLRSSTMLSDYLLLCIKQSKYTTAMSALSVQDMKSDFELFEAIRDIYKSRKLKILQLMPLTAIKRIDFVKFLLCESSLVDCIKRNQLPPKTIEFYSFDPRKPRVIPPIGTEFLLHRFHSPRCGSGKSRCLKQFPKRLNQRPLLGQPPDDDVGWGVHIVEGPHFATVVTWHIAAAAVGSLLFGILYWCFEKDISGAFTVSAYMTSLSSLLIGAWQVWMLSG